MTIELKLEEIIAVKDALETVIPALLELYEYTGRRGSVLGMAQ